MNTIRQLGAYGRTLIGYENYQKIRSTRTGIEKAYRQTYTDDGISGYTSEEAGSHKKLEKPRDAMMLPFGCYLIIIKITISLKTIILNEN